YSVTGCATPSIHSCAVAGEIRPAPVARAAAAPVTAQTSVTEPLVHDVTQLLAGAEAPQVVEEDLQHPLEVARRGAGVVAGDDHVVHGPQCRPLRQRLLFEHVEPGAGYLAAL